MELYISADAIDNGQNKKAVQLVDKILKKQESLHCAKVRAAFVTLAQVVIICTSRGSWGLHTE